MGYILKSETDLETFLNSGLTIDPIIITKGGYYSAVNYTSDGLPISLGFKNVLTAANSDYLALSTTITCNTNEPLIFNFYLGAIGTQFDLASQSNSASLSRITVLASGSILVGCQVSPVSTGLAAMVGLNTIELTFNGVDNDLIVNGTPVNMPSQTLPFILLQVGKRGTFYAGIEVYDFTVNDKIINLNESNGFNFYDSNSNLLGTRETAAADPLNYVNTVMIQPIT